jgi:hypothetical protein
MVTNEVPSQIDGDFGCQTWKPALRPLTFYGVCKSVTGDPTLCLLRYLQGLQALAPRPWRPPASPYNENGDQPRMMVTNSRLRQTVTVPIEK